MLWKYIVDDALTEDTNLGEGLAGIVSRDDDLRGSPIGSNGFCFDDEVKRKPKKKKVTREELEQILKAQYSKDKPSRRATRLAFDYIKRTDSVLDEDVYFIKKLTKVASKAIKSRPDVMQKSYNDCTMEKLYQFHIDGALAAEIALARLNNNSSPSYKEERGKLIKMRTHLYGHAGTIAGFIYDNVTGFEEKLKWKRIQYNHKLCAASDESEKNWYRAKNYLDSAEAAFEIFRLYTSEENRKGVTLRGEIELWRTRAKEAYEQSIIYSKSIGKKDSNECRAKFLKQAKKGLKELAKYSV